MNEPTIDESLPTEYAADEGEVLPLAEVAKDVSEAVSLPDDEAEADIPAALVTDSSSDISVTATPDDPSGRDEALTTETAVPVEFGEVNLPEEVASEADGEQPAIPVNAAQADDAELTPPQSIPAESASELDLPSGPDSETDSKTPAMSASAEEFDNPELPVPDSVASDETDVAFFGSDRPDSDVDSDFPVPESPVLSSEDILDLPETDAVDEPEQLDLGADVAGGQSDLPIASATGVRDEPRLELPGESMDSNVPLATADRPAESESIDLPVSSEPGMEDGGELPLASDPVQDVWGAGAVDWGNSRSGDRADNTPSSVNVEVKVPDNFMEGLEQQIEPHIRHMRTAMQDRTAAMFEDQAVLAGLNTIPE